MSELFARIERLFVERGEGQYGQERVTQQTYRPLIERMALA
jgi:hypothetical protein